MWFCWFGYRPIGGGASCGSAPSAWSGRGRNFFRFAHHGPASQALINQKAGRFHRAILPPVLSASAAPNNGSAGNRSCNLEQWQGGRASGLHFYDSGHFGATEMWICIGPNWALANGYGWRPINFEYMPLPPLMHQRGLGTFAHSASHHSRRNWSTKLAQPFLIATNPLQPSPLLPQAWLSWPAAFSGSTTVTLPTLKWIQRQCELTAFRACRRHSRRP